MNRRALLAASAAAFVGPAAAPVDFKGDIQIVRRALELRPGLYRYSTRSEIEQRLGTLESDFAHAATLEARNLSLSRFLATIRCGHTYCNFFNQPTAVASGAF